MSKITQKLYQVNQNPPPFIYFKYISLFLPQISYWKNLQDFLFLKYVVASSKFELLLFYYVKPRSIFLNPIFN